MTPNNYQKLASRTLTAKPEEALDDAQSMLVWNALGLVGEAGEVAEYVKKAIFHRHDLDREKLKKELGDVLWYAAALCTNLDLTMEEVMEANIEKLQQRYPDGFSSNASKNRNVNANRTEL
ncbi:MAG: nucleoside triphosphate pyrophosphohydrolase family protein [Rhodothermales bacterium]